MVQEFKKTGKLKDSAVLIVQQTVYRTFTTLTVIYGAISDQRRMCTTHTVGLGYIAVPAKRGQLG